VRTGQLCQSVGIFFLFGSCCLWSFSGRLVEPASAPATRWADYLAGDRLPAAILTINVATTLVGGLGLLAVGIGLHGERRGSGAAACIVTGSMSLIHGASCVALTIRAGAALAGVTAGILALFGLVLFMLSLHSAALLRRYPPPADQNVVTDAFLEEYRSRRRR
jgi:hypothetical protein